jgi:hypothetical protein
MTAQGEDRVFCDRNPGLNRFPQLFCSERATQIINPINNVHRILFDIWSTMLEARLHDCSN